MEQSTLSESLRQVSDLQSLRAGWNGSDALPPAGQPRADLMRWSGG